MKPHPHAEVIKQWADGATIEAYTINEDRWYEVANPSWELSQYRVKPEKAYPETRMSRGQIKAAFHNGGWRSIANAALRHAIDAGQVVAAENYSDHLDVTEGDIKFRVGGSKRDIAALMAFCARNTKSEHQARDREVAYAVWQACLLRGNSNLDLDAIIAGVKP